MLRTSIFLIIHCLWSTRDQVPTYTYILYMIFVCSHMVMDNRKCVLFVWPTWVVSYFSLFERVWSFSSVRDCRHMHTQPLIQTIYYDLFFLYSSVVFLLLLLLLLLLLCYHTHCRRERNNNHFGWINVCMCVYNA